MNNPFSIMSLGFLLASIMSGAMFVGWMNGWLSPGGRKGRADEQPLSRDQEHQPLVNQAPLQTDFSRPVAPPIFPPPQGEQAAVTLGPEPQHPIETSPAAPDLGLGPEPAPEPKSEPEPKAASEALTQSEATPVRPEKAAKPKAPEKALKSKPARKMSKPEAPLPPDDLTVIRGIGAKLSTMLAERGTTRFDQIAAWTRDDIKQVEQAMKFPGRVKREQWVEQARALARGNARKGKAQKPKRV